MNHNLKSIFTKVTNAEPISNNEIFIMNAFNMNGIKYASIPVNEMEVDYDYQRDPKKVYKIAKEWDIRKVGVITVSYRNGKFIVIDGQNRMLAAQTVGERFLPCQIWEDIGAKQEAGIFATQDENKTTLTTYDKFRARLIEENETAIKLKNLCDEYNIAIKKIVPDATGTLTGLSTAQKIYNTYGENVLRFIFNVIKKSNWHNVQGAYSDIILSSLCTIYLNYASDLKMTSKNLVKFLSGTSPKIVIAEGCVKYLDRGRKAATTAYLNDIVENLQVKKISA